jgi:4-amino-4-deoxy-L-arabinose transferase-like glycosyltransferase
MSPQLPSWLFLAAVVVALLVPSLLQDGMFIDGTVYATVSRNLAQGIGEMWQPQFACQHPKVFYEQPPLMFWLQSCFFRFFGDFTFVERLFSFLNYLCTGVLVVLFWRKTMPSQQHLAWLPLLLFTTTPIVFWTYRNNMLEGTFLFFDTLALFTFYFYAQKKKNYWLIIGILAIFMAFLTKGLVALFPIAFFFFYFLMIEKKIKRGILWSAFVAISIFLLLSLLCVTTPKAYYFFTQYVDIQLLRSLRGQRELAPNNNRFYVLARLLQEISPMLIFAIVIISVAYFKQKLTLTNFQIKKASLWFCVGLSATLPLLLSPKQNSFYIMPAMLFFALSVAVFIAPTLQKYFIPVRFQWFFTIILLGASIFYAQKEIKKQYARDEKMITDIKILHQILPRCTTIALHQQYYKWHSVETNLQRYAQIDVDYDNIEAKNEYFLSSNPTDFQSPTYKKIENIDLQYFTLWRR